MRRLGPDRAALGACGWPVASAGASRASSAFHTVPFLLLGVVPEVIAGYFLMYSVNGLFQHSNVRLRYG